MSKDPFVEVEECAWEISEYTIELDAAKRDFCAHLDKCIQRHPDSLRTIAKRAGVGYSFLSMLRQGKTAPSPDTAQADRQGAEGEQTERRGPMNPPRGPHSEGQEGLGRRARIGVMWRVAP